ncbi:MAG: AMP-binding protein, partial [Burkholderiaceae bacterium]
MPTALNDGVPDNRVEIHYGDRAMRCFVDRPASLDAMFRATAAAHAEREAVVFEADRLRYAELDARVERTAQGLVAAGVARGDRVALFAGNHLACLVALLAIVRSGAICVPIGIRQQRAELAFILGQCAARVLIFDAASAARVPALQDVPTIERFYVCDGEPDAAWSFGQAIAPFSVLAQSDAVQVLPTLDEDDTAFLMYTSGTTGFPKGARLSHVGFWHTLKHYQLAFGYAPGARSLLAIPASHISGLLACIYVMFSVGGCVVVQREFNARRTLELIEQERITATIFVPSIYNLLLRCPDFDRFDLATYWRIGHFGGAPMPEATVA